MIWTLNLHKKARRQIKKTNTDDRTLLRRSLLSLQINPFTGDTKPVRSRKGVLRHRTGVWRIFFSVYLADKIIDVLEINRRSDTTYERGRGPIIEI